MMSELQARNDRGRRKDRAPAGFVRRKKGGAPGAVKSFKSNGALFRECMSIRTGSRSGQLPRSPLYGQLPAGRRFAVQLAIEGNPRLGH